MEVGDVAIFIGIDVGKANNHRATTPGRGGRRRFARRHHERLQLHERPGPPHPTRPPSGHGYGTLKGRGHRWPWRRSRP